MATLRRRTALVDRQAIAPRRRSRVIALTGLAVAAATLVGCGESDDRREAHETLTAQLVDAGLPDDLVDCVVEGFFDVRSDADLRAFYERESLTEDEVEEFARLAELCAD